MLQFVRLIVLLPYIFMDTVKICNEKMKFDTCEIVSNCHLFFSVPKFS